MGVKVVVWIVGVLKDHFRNCVYTGLYLLLHVIIMFVNLLFYVESVILSVDV